MSATPGPWTAKYSTLDTPGWRVTSVARQTEPYGAYPALLANFAYSEDGTAEANAHLLAAAPDLFNSLTEILALFPPASRDQLDPDVRHTLARAEAAIAKAGVSIPTKAGT